MYTIYASRISLVDINLIGDSGQMPPFNDIKDEHTVTRTAPSRAATYREETGTRTAALTHIGVGVSFASASIQSLLNVDTFLASANVAQEEEYGFV